MKKIIRKILITIATVFILSSSIYAQEKEDKTGEEKYHVGNERDLMTVSLNLFFPINVGECSFNEYPFSLNINSSYFGKEYYCLEAGLNLQKNKFGTPIFYEIGAGTQVQFYLNNIRLIPALKIYGGISLSSLFEKEWIFDYGWKTELYITHIHWSDFNICIIFKDNFLNYSKKADGKLRFLSIGIGVSYIGG
jgi:hypothetical protein